MNPRKTDSRCGRCGETTAYRPQCWLCGSRDMEHRAHTAQVGTLWCSTTPYKTVKDREHVKQGRTPAIGGSIVVAPPRASDR